MAIPTMMSPIAYMAKSHCEAGQRFHVCHFGAFIPDVMSDGQIRLKKWKDAAC